MSNRPLAVRTSLPATWFEAARPIQRQRSLSPGKAVLATLRHLTNAQVGAMYSVSLYTVSRWRKEVGEPGDRRIGRPHKARP